MAIKELEIKQAEIRQILINEIKADMVGPRQVDEVLRINPKNEYLAGVFFPGNWEIDDDDKVREIGGESSEEDNSDAPVASDKLYKPSSFGLTCRLTPDTKKIIANIEYGRYQAVKDKETGHYSYYRTPLKETFDISIESGTDERIFKTQSEFKIQYEIIKKEGQIILDFYVVNNAEKKEKNSFYDILFQPKIILESIDKQYCFVEDTLDTHITYDVAEDEHMKLLFNKKISFGKGHLCAVEWDENAVKNRKINKIETTFVPKQAVDRINPTELDKKIDAINMNKIANCSNKKELKEILQPLLTKYEEWVDETKNKIKDENIVPKDKTDLAERKIKRIKEITIKRMQKGIDAVTDEKNNDAFEAFKFANLAIAWQQTMAEWAKGNAETNEIKGHDPLEPKSDVEWRLFQIAFILLNIESITNPKSEDREVVDLLWFPTGGGKTEAYLGLVAFVIAFRRLRGKNESGEITDKSIGTSVLMRYTLRLLTVQQFQRSATLMCACEKIRVRDLKKWGGHPFQVGLWVGGSVTPNRRKKGEHSALKAKYRIIDSGNNDLTQIHSYNPYILINCPWCGKELKPSNGEISGEPEQWRLFCGRTQCMFSKHLDVNKDMSLPVVLVDDDVYSRCPSLIIATVDKFAQISWRPDCGAIFGNVEKHCNYCGFYNPLTSDKHTHPEIRNKPEHDKYDYPVELLPPELIIQDELHLISGPLGSMAGLYETAIEYLCISKDGIKPKIITSTATTRAASDQISKLFNRDRTEIFPPQVIEFGNTFFSEIENVNSEVGKTYIGVMATGKSGLTVLARISAVILRRIRQLAESGTNMDYLDPYFTLVSYFNSQRELGGASMNFRDSVPNFISRIQNQFEGNLPTLQKPQKQEEVSIEEAETQEIKSEIESEPEPIAKKFNNQFFSLVTEELTSRRSSGEIPEILRKLDKKIKNVDDPVDLLLATNMLSVGVDIRRLGVMVINGQPKNHSEYIQATGRIGRSNPGLIVTLYSYTKPRDLSHFENFKIYHSTFYKNVETVALTPFTVRARQIGLFGVLVGMLRMKKKRLSSNDDAARFDPKDSDQQKIIEEIKRVFENRVRTVDPNEQKNTMDNIDNLINIWIDYKKAYKELLKYADYYNDKMSKELRESFWYLLKSDPASKKQLIPTPTSLRNAEQEQKLFYHQTEVVNNE